mgnify:FL=1
MNKYLLVFIFLFSFQNVWQLTFSTKSAIVILSEENHEDQSSAEKLFKECIVSTTSAISKWIRPTGKEHENIIYISQSVTSVIINVETPPPNKFS